MLDESFNDCRGTVVYVPSGVAFSFDMMCGGVGNEVVSRGRGGKRVIGKAEGEAVKTERRLER